MAKRLQVKQWAIKFTDSPQDFDRDKNTKVVRLYRTRAGANSIIKAWWKPQDISARAVQVTISETSND